MLDHLAPYRGAFSYALDWGRRFHLPIKGVARSAVNSAGGTWCGIQACLDEPLSATNSSAQPCSLGSESPTEKCACAQLCRRWGVRWELVRSQGLGECELAQLTEPGDLLVFGKALAPRLKRELFLQAIHGTVAPLLICSDIWQPSSRVLLVDQGQRGSYRFLECATGMCRVLEATPVILTIARSERFALRRQREVQDVLARDGVHADFDFIVGCETRSAVMSVARWRRCPFLVMEQKTVAPWWRWFRGDGSSWLAEMAESLTIMTLPVVPGTSGLPGENSGTATAEELGEWNSDTRLSQTPHRLGSGFGGGSAARRGVE
jgi:hypothetical protein